MRLWLAVILSFYLGGNALAQNVIHQMNSSWTDLGSVALRTGTYSNRSVEGTYNCNGTKTWSFYDMTSGWDSYVYAGTTSNNGGSMTINSNVLTCSNCNFTSNSVGMGVEVTDAGPVNGTVATMLNTTIATYISSTQVTLSQAASRTVTGKKVYYGRLAYTEGYLSGSSSNDFRMNFRLLKPVGYDSDTEPYQYPIIVMLHGVGEGATCNGGCYTDNDQVPTGTNVTGTAYTIVTADNSRSIGFTRSSGTTTVTLPGTLADGFACNLVHSGAGTLNIITSGGATFTGVSPLPTGQSMVVRFNSTTKVWSVLTGSDYNQYISQCDEADIRFRNNDGVLINGGQTHLKAVYDPSTGANGKKPDDPTLKKTAFPGFVLFPQVYGKKSVYDDGWANDPERDRVAAIIELLVNYYRIDPNRIYLHGLSDGGRGVWAMLMDYPQLFAAVAPMSAIAGPLINSSIDPDVVPVPAWVFQGGKDLAPPQSYTEDYLKKLKDAGGTPKYTLYPNLGHGVWETAYKDADFFPWLLRQNKSNIHVMFGDSTICGTNGQGARLAVSPGFLAYQWERDGVVISGATSNTYTATIPGAYRARFSRISASPSEAQWNKWSNPVVVRELVPAAPVISTNSSPLQPDIHDNMDGSYLGNGVVRIQSPANENLIKWIWTKKGQEVLPQLPSQAASNTYTFTRTNTSVNEEIANPLNWLRATGVTKTIGYVDIQMGSQFGAGQGMYTLQTAGPSGCPSLPSNPIFVTRNTYDNDQATTPNPSNGMKITDPSNLLAKVTGSESIQLYWKDNANNETAYEVMRRMASDSLNFATGTATVSKKNNTSGATTTETVNILVSTFRSEGKTTATIYTVVSPQTGFTYTVTGTTISTTNRYAYYPYNKLLSEDAISFEDTGLIPNTTYYYAVRGVGVAFNAAAGTYSTHRSNYIQTTAVTLGDTQPPSPPQNLQTTRNTINSITLNWLPSTDDSGIKEYYVYRNGTKITTSTPITDTTYTATGLTVNTSYAFTVKAVDLKDKLSDASNQLMASTVVTGLYYSHAQGTYLSFLDVNGTDPDGAASAADLPDWAHPEITGHINDFSQALDAKLQDKFFYFKYDGYIKPPSTATNYQFRITSNDGSAMYIGTLGSATAFTATKGYPGPGNPRGYNSVDANNSPIVVNDASSAMASGATRIIENDVNAITYPNANNHPLDSTRTVTSSNQSLNASQFYPITVIYWQRTGGLNLSVEYRIGTGTWQPIPASMLTTGTAPVSNPAAPTNLQVSVPALPAGITQLQLSWQHANVSSVDFEIWRSKVNVDSTYQIIHREETATSYTDTSLTPNTTYYYKIKAVSNTGISAFVGPVSATTLPDTEAPSVPTNLAVAGSTFTNAALTWDASTDNIGIAGYRVYENGNLVGTVTQTAFTSTSLFPGTAYSYYVVAVDVGGTPSAASNTVQVNTPTLVSYYSVAGTDITLLASWKPNANGTGTSPSTFNANGQRYIVQSNTNTLSANWAVGGAISRIIVADGVTLNLNRKVVGKISAGNNSVVDINFAETGFNFEFDQLSATSTVNFNSYSALPAVHYGSLSLNGSGIKNLSAGTTEISGNLQVANGVELKSTASNGSVIKVGGNFTLGTLSSAGTAADNWPTIQFSANAQHNFTSTRNPGFYKLIAEQGAVINYSSSSPTTISAGSLNGGGGVELANGSTLSISSNTLAITGNSAINPENTTGRIAIDNGSFQLTTTSTDPSNLYFDPAHNNIENFTIQMPTGNTTHIHEAVEVYDGIKINSGILNADGKVTIKSSAAASASIRRIEGGSIEGDVTVERYMAPKGRLYRYISSPLAGIKVADWQTYIPITGAFSGASTGPGLTANPSMYYYNESDPAAWLAYPVTNNQQPIQVGRGYSVFIREGVNPTTLVTSGEANQGNIPFTLTGGTGSVSNGWNLLGNPYASDIVWDNAGWISSGISNVVSVRENLPGGASQFKFWDRSTSLGTLENGKIPAGQAFWVQTNTASPSLTITEAAKTTESAAQNTEFYRVASTETNANAFETFSIALTNGTYTDNAFVKFAKEGSDSYTKMTDGEKRSNSYFNLSTVSSDQVSLAVNEVSSLFCEKTILVNLQNIAAGTYTLKFELDKLNTSALTLVDSYLNKTTEITKAQNIASFTVTSQANSYQNRFTVKLKRIEVATSLSATAADASLCESEKYAEVFIDNSQLGVEYNLVINGSILSEKIKGTDGQISLMVPMDKLLPGENQIKVQAGLEGCTLKQLDQPVAITVLANPKMEVSQQVVLSGCVGSAFDVKLNSNMLSGSYRWEDLDSRQTLKESSNQLMIASLPEYSSLQVTAISDAGCESQPVGITIQADTLTTPQIKIVDEETFKTESTGEIQWLLNGDVIEGGTEQQLQPQESGSYTVSVTNGFCTLESVPVDFAITGLTPHSELTVQVYPNPAIAGKVTVKVISGNDGLLQIQLTDMSGKLIVTKDVSHFEHTKGLEWSESLPPGMYLLKVVQQGITVHKKLVVF